MKEIWGWGTPKPERWCRFGFRVRIRRMRTPPNPTEGEILEFPTSHSRNSWDKLWDSAAPPQHWGSQPQILGSFFPAMGMEGEKSLKFQWDFYWGIKKTPQNYQNKPQKASFGDNHPRNSVNIQYLRWEFFNFSVLILFFNLRGFFDFLFLI